MEWTKTADETPKKLPMIGYATIRKKGKEPFVALGYFYPALKIYDKAKFPRAYSPNAVFEWPEYADPTKHKIVFCREIYVDENKKPHYEVYTQKEIIAWMPTPEPYTEDEE